MKSLLDKGFRYVPSLQTDLAETFKRVRAEQEKAATATAQKVAAIKPRVKGRTP